MKKDPKVVLVKRLVEDVSIAVTQLPTSVFSMPHAEQIEISMSSTEKMLDQTWKKDVLVQSQSSNALNTLTLVA
jgi:hypothetical protein